MRKSSWTDRLLLFGSPAALMLLLEGFSRSAPGYGRGMVSLGAFALTYVLWMAVCWVLSLWRSLRGRAMLTAAVALAASLTGVANRYKIRYRMEPVLFSDLYQLGDAAQAARSMGFSISFVEIALILAAFLLALLCCLRLRGRSPKRRALPLVGLALLLAVPPLCTFDRFTTEARYDLVDTAQTDGTLYTALAVENQRRELMRLDYSEADVRSRYRELSAHTPTRTAQEPNIILVLAESFADEAWLGQYLDFTREITPFYNDLVQRSLSGRIDVPKVGGGTSETEFEVLTGLRSQYAINPYAMGLPPMSSLASVLRDRGYRASAIHWQTGVYYNRYNNLRRLGFQEFFTTDTTLANFEKKGQYVSDAAHFRAALAQLKRTPERDFVFVLTMQNHGGYAYADFRELYGADTPFTNRLDAETEKMAANFCWMLGETDRALRELVEELERFEEPTLLVLYGDHIPPFGEEAYADLGVDLTAREAHMTPYLIWSNESCEAAQEDLYAWQLGAKALEMAGMNDDPFLHYVSTLQKPDDPVHALLSYDALFGRQYSYAEGQLHPESEQMHIGGEMVLEGFETALIGDRLYLHPVLRLPRQKHELLINGQAAALPWIGIESGRLEMKVVMTGLRGAQWNESATLSMQMPRSFWRRARRGRIPSVRSTTGNAPIPPPATPCGGLYRPSPGEPPRCFAVGKPWNWRPPSASKPQGSTSWMIRAMCSWR